MVLSQGGMKMITTNGKLIPTIIPTDKERAILTTNAIDAERKRSASDFKNARDRSGEPKRMIKTNELPKFAIVPNDHPEQLAGAIAYGAKIGEKVEKKRGRPKK